MTPAVVRNAQRTHEIEKIVERLGKLLDGKLDR